MRTFLRVLLTFLALSSISLATAPAESRNPTLLTRPWVASWISHPTANLQGFGVYHFRKDLNLTEKPSRYVVHVSADNRYRLYVNGHSIAVGPARGDPLHWHYETLDLAPHLRAGKNTLAAVVWNQGADRAVAQMTSRTAFLLAGDTEAERAADTGPGWKVYQDQAYAPIPLPARELHTYIVVGASERFNSAAHPWGWEQPTFDDNSWDEAKVIARAFAAGTGTGSSWYLVPRTIPLPVEQPQRFQAVRRSDGLAPPRDWLSGQSAWTLPAHSQVTVLLDHGRETTAYPELQYSGGAGATVEVHYAEALIDAKREKGNRNDLEGKTLHGYHDTILPDGAEHRLYSPLWYRCFRYVELRIQTQDTPLVIEDIRSRFTAYPFEERGRFSSDDPSIQEIWNVGWHTARLCAFETYMDCPYYEQLQYLGDTRIQALISLYAAGDDRLMRQAITLYDRSRIPEGLTQSRFPSHDPQVINTFSLFWVSMVRDYWRHRDDLPFTRTSIPGTRAVLRWFTDRIDARTGLLGPLPYWTFVDWPDEWQTDDVSLVGGVPEGAVEGGSSIVSLHLAITLREAAELEDAVGHPRLAGDYRTQADAIIRAVRERCWDSARGYFADSPLKRDFSQHANILAVLADAVSGTEAQDLIRRTAGDSKLIQSTYYFDFYLLRALKHAGLGDGYVAALQPWREMLERGLTTFAERQDPTRSDCHAWSASPNYELLATVCGIEPAAPGFKRVRIAPNPGPLNHLEGLVPHPAGTLSLCFTREGDHGSAEIELPPGIDGEFVWQKKTHPIKGGKQTIRW